MNQTAHLVFLLFFFFARRPAGAVPVLATEGTTDAGGDLLRPECSERYPGDARRPATHHGQC